MPRLAGADRERPVEPSDLEARAHAAHLTGKEAEGEELLARAHQEFAKRGENRRAARCAFWLGFLALIQGKAAQSGGWLSRAERFLEGEANCVERGYLLLPSGYRCVHGGDPAGAYATFRQAAEIGRRFGDKDLATLALQGQGRALIRQGEIERGVNLLDEAMVAVTANEVSPIVAGGVYCSVIEACGEIFDVRRAQEWTAALERWCAEQSESVPYRGHCLVRRAEILQLRGAWGDALAEAQRASTWFSQPEPKPSAGNALYRMAELHRLRGEFDKAEQAYRQASQWNHTAQPGLALLRLAQGRTESAASALRDALEHLKEPAKRARALEAYVEIALAGGDGATAREAAEELSATAERYRVTFLHALACSAMGAVLLAEGEHRVALRELRKAWRMWCEQDTPYEAARVRVLMGLACREIGNLDAAELELAAARQAFERLGATPDLVRIDELFQTKAACRVGGLTERELEVLRLIASGMKNRAIAGKLKISEKTVARHVSNIFMKLDLSSRAAATAYAYEHALVRPA
ncbi:MAG TPA: LuxR C-terminal-related transcriptional regulator [Terriglobales bacterium]|nr:LuxR C-terminal-related transcriptional regulator [Terriglobales bacterium]